MERTFLMIKPDGVQRGLIGEIIGRLEKKGFQMVGCKLTQISKQLAATHYVEHQGKSFYEELVQFITSGPVVAMVWQGDDIIALSRQLVGKTNVADALPGTIRGDFAAHTSRNLIHGSDSRESAAREIDLFFQSDDLIEYNQAITVWL